jgi:hypothetical protein
MGHDELLQIRAANLAQIDELAGILRQQQLTAEQRTLLVSLRQARLIELGAIERYLQIAQTIQPKHRRRRRDRLC